MADLYAQPPSRSKQIPLKVQYEHEKPNVATHAFDDSIQNDLESLDPDMEALAEDDSFKKSMRLEARYPSTILEGKPLPYIPLSGILRTPSGRF